MVTVQKHHDGLPRRRLESPAAADPDYWSFTGNSRSEYGHGMFQ
jgi:hypothetical protein